MDVKHQITCMRSVHIAIPPSIPQEGYIDSLILLPFSSGGLLVLSLNKDDYLQIFKCVSF